MIKVGLIGCGKIAQVRHIPEYDANGESKLYGFFDQNYERAEMLAKQYGAKVYASYEEMLADPEIDAVSVLTPNVTHGVITVAALKAGKHVLCEKPMAVTIQECEQMIQAAEESGKKLMIAQNQRLTEAHKKVKELLGQGIIGKIITFHTVFAHKGADNWSIDGKNSWFLDKNKSCFGALADLGVHKTDLMIYLLDSKIDKVSSIIGTLDKKDEHGKPISVDDNAFCTYHMENGAMGTMQVGWTNYGKEENITSLYGTLGAIHIYRNPDHAIEVELKDGTASYYDVDQIQTNDHQTSTGVIDTFIDAIRKDQEPEISAKKVLPAMKAIFACVESAKENGKMIPVL